VINYTSAISLARQMSRFTENLKPAAFVPVDDALPIVHRVLRCSFLPPEAVDGPEEHAFFATCASVLAAKVRRVFLTDGQVTRIYRAALKGKQAALNSEEAAFLQRLGIRGVHIFDSEVTGPGGDDAPAA
jgi:hypothetical protein